MSLIKSRTADDVSRMGKAQTGLKKTVGLSKLTEQRLKSKSRAMMMMMEDSREDVEQQIQRKVVSKPPRPSRSGRNFEPMAATIKEDEEEAETYDHGVVDLWLQKNALRTTSTPRRRHTKSKKTFKAIGDTSVITDSTLKAGNFLPWELGN